MISTEHIPYTASDEPRLMKNTAILQKAQFMKSLRYIFLTEWQLRAKRVDPGSCRAPRAPSNRQLVAHMDPRVPKMEAKLLAQQGVSVVLLPLNKGICHFSWQEQDCSVSFWTDYSICDPWSNIGGFISASSNRGSWRPACPSKKTLVIGRDKAHVDRGPGQWRSCVNWWQGQEMKSIWVSSGNRGAWLSKR